MGRWEEYREKHLRRLREAMERGEVDPPVIPLLELVNSVPDLVTTSSCSGRIVLLGTSKEEDKASSFFHRKWHRPVMFEEVVEGYQDFGGDVLWFKFDPLILHVAARTLRAGYLLVRGARAAGIKVTGIQVISPWKVHVEVRGIDHMAVPLYWDGEPLVEEDYLRSLVHIANRKMVKNQRRLERLYEEWYKLFNDV